MHWSYFWGTILLWKKEVKIKKEVRVKRVKERKCYLLQTKWLTNGERQESSYIKIQGEHKNITLAKGAEILLEISQEYQTLIVSTVYMCDMKIINIRLYKVY